MAVEESIIEDWFTQEKEKLEEEYLNVLHSVHDDDTLKKAHRRFEKRYCKLIAEYQHRLQKFDNQVRRKNAIATPIARWRAKWNAARTQTSDWIARKREEFRKWRFDKKVRKILKDKRDL